MCFSYEPDSGSQGNTETSEILNWSEDRPLCFLDSGNRDDQPPGCRFE